MLYFVMAVIGAAAGFFISKYMGSQLNMTMCLVLGVIGGLVGGAIATLFSSVAVVLFELIVSLAGAVALIYGVQKFQQKKQ